MARAKVFQIPATLEGISTLKDGGMSVRFHTNEMSNYNKTKLMGFSNSFGWLLFSEKAIHDLPAEAPRREAGVKTPSQRLRASLFVLWQQKYGDQPFDPWYEQQMEKIINKVKEQLE